MGKSSFGSAVLLINAILVIAGLSACGSDSSLPDTNRASPVFFVANDGTHGMELWKTDGTASGTSMVRDIFPGAGSSTFEGLEQYEMGGFTYFMATEPIHGTELWKTDGTTDGTTLVRDINPAPGIGSLVVHLPGVVSNGRLYFRAEDQTDNLELWATDGTETGTVLIKDIRPPTSESIWHLSEFAALGDLVLFGALNISSGSGLWVSELWVSDGSTSGTRKITDVLPAIGGSYSSRIGQLAGRLYFWANDTSDNFGFWASDGTEAGTQLVKAGVLPSAGTSGPQSMVVVHNWLLFSAQDSSGSGQELWRSDGSEIGTVLVKDINPGWADSSPDYLTVMNGVAYFVANDGTHGYELWSGERCAPRCFAWLSGKPPQIDRFREHPVLRCGRWDPWGRALEI